MIVDVIKDPANTPKLWSWGESWGSYIYTVERPFLWTKTWAFTQRYFCF